MISMVQITTRLAVMLLAVTAILGAANGADGVTQQAMLKAVNAIRQQHKVTQLQIHPRLQMMAREQSGLMAGSGKMSHKVNWKNGFRSRLKRAGYRGFAAENIAKGQQSLQRVLQSWMDSTSHRRNMLNPRMRYFGLARVQGKGRNYWTMVLGG
jgi:uncharacterized protein YkwD